MSALNPDACDLQMVSSEAFESQKPHLVGATYLFAEFSDILGNGCGQATVTSTRGQAGPSGRVGFVGSDRRMKCRKASSCLQCSVLSPRFPRAVSNSKKSTSLLIRSRSQSSPYTPANISNSTSGRAFRSVPLCNPTSLFVDPCQRPALPDSYGLYVRATSRGVNFSRRESFSCLHVLPFSLGLPLSACLPVHSLSRWPSRLSPCQTNSEHFTAPMDTSCRAMSVWALLCPVSRLLVLTRQVSAQLPRQHPLRRPRRHQSPIRCLGRTRTTTRITTKTPTKTQIRTADPEVARGLGAFSLSAFLPNQEALAC
ncbi:hypothetical protein SAMN06265370_11030 [Puniceibacterium sediminis]|uniref:Uncharacterized protein n=1 Tax=Puniceibacterium sediminis TaxID=1608407 RepID=A0A238XAJ0_9RHOB|nr:hypothetical protein SAMN06265370_11030 [Puniceibacterium sediminis]